MDKDYIILVDEKNNPWGKLEKELVHQLGLLHRAFSVFIFNSKGEMLLQQRADNKYHSAGLWTNTCCSHPRWGEETADAVERRLEEEMGLKCNVDFAFEFIYKTTFENGLTEHELDFVYTGVSDNIPEPYKEEVMSWRYAAVDEIRNSIATNPELYTYWFKLIFERVVSTQQKAFAA